MDILQEERKTVSMQKPLQNLSAFPIASFWEINPEERAAILMQAIIDTHKWHFPRNNSYRRTVEARGIEAEIAVSDLARLLRPTSQVFKSYIDLLGTPFPQDKTEAFIDWLADQVSLHLPVERAKKLHSRYPSMEAILQAVEALYADYGFEFSTSSGTSGRASIMLRDKTSMDRTVESFYLSYKRYFGMQVDHRAVFVMPAQTRIAMARMVNFSVKRIGIPSERTHFTIPFPAYPDQVRIRSGRVFKGGWRGQIERHILYPLMNRINDRFITPQAVKKTIEILRKSQETGEKVLLFSGWIQLHRIAQEIISIGKPITLLPGSLMGTGGGFKEFYEYTPEQIHHDLKLAVRTIENKPVPVRDVYGMAESNWAAMQCDQGNYHIPPWVFSVTLDDNDALQQGSDQTGLLAFFDPYGGGQLFPAFFKTADRTRLINGSLGYDPALNCLCGDQTAYMAKGSITRVDLIDEAGCAAQV